MQSAGVGIVSTLVHESAGSGRRHHDNATWIRPELATGHAGGSTAHDIATNSLIIHLFAAAFYIGGLVAVIAHTWVGGTRVALALRRYSAVATVAASGSKPSSWR